MAAARGRKETDLSRVLADQPHRFGFFQAVRLLEWIAREGATTDQPTFPGVGRYDLPRQEFVHFRLTPSLTFPGAEVAKVRLPEPGADGWPVQMVTSFLGLVGAAGVLPHHYTAQLLDRIRKKDAGLRDFLDVFQHRLVSHFYRAWEKYRLPVAVERKSLENQNVADNPVTVSVECFIGMGTAGLQKRLEVADQAFVYYAGHFSHHPRCVASLEALLHDYFEMPVRLLSFQGRWLELAEADTSRLGSRNHSVGRSFIAGRRVWDIQGQFRVRIGPLRYEQFERFMPSGNGLLPLVQLTRQYAGSELDFDIQVVLRGDEVPAFRLGKGKKRAQLGWNTWIRTRPLGRDAEEAVFRLPDF